MLFSCKCLPLSRKDKLLLRKMSARGVRVRERERETHSNFMLSKDQIGCLYFCGCKHTPGMLRFHQAKTRPNRPRCISRARPCVCSSGRLGRSGHLVPARRASGGFSNQFNPLRGGGERINKMARLLKGSAANTAPLCVCAVPSPPPVHTMGRPVCF